MTFYGIKLSDVSPCPLCNKEIEYIGHTCSMSMGVVCTHCHLELRRQLPSYWPKGCETIKDIEKHTLRLAVKTWNRRKIISKGEK